MINKVTKPKPQITELATRDLLQSIRQQLLDKKRVLILLSGGSCLELIDNPSFSYLLENAKATIMVLDEKFSSDPKLNNSLQIKKLGIDILETVPEKNETLTEFGQRFNKILEKEYKRADYTIATVGMGPDGHIAGISPMATETEFNRVFKQKIFAAPYESNLTPKDRVTVTPEFIIKKIDKIIMYVTGDAKKDALKHLFDLNEQAHKYPVTILKESKRDIHLYTDIEL